MKYRIKITQLEVDMDLSETEPLNAALTGLFGSLASSFTRAGFGSPLGGLGGTGTADDGDDPGGNKPPFQ